MICRPGVHQAAFRFSTRVGREEAHRHRNVLVEGRKEREARPRFLYAAFREGVMGKKERRGRGAAGTMT